MRLREAEHKGILSACNQVAAGRKHTLYLFGSRADSEKKGGDIDLLMVVSAENLKSMLLDKHHFLVEIKSKIGEQKIDLIITTEEHISKDEFLKSIKPDCILL